MRRPVKPRVCAGCNRELSEKSFKPKKYSATNRRRTNAYCNDCRDKILHDAPFLRQWDWASAVCKGTSRLVTRYKDGVWSTRIDHVVLHALMSLQQGQCAISCIKLIYPTSFDALPMGIQLQQWAADCGISERNQLAMPVLVRAVKSGPWEPGNLVFIAAFMKDAYDFAGSVAAAAAMLERPTPVVPTATMLTERRAAVERAMAEAWHAKQQEQKQEQLYAETKTTPKKPDSGSAPVPPVQQHQHGQS